MKRLLSTPRTYFIRRLALSAIILGAMLIAFAAHVQPRPAAAAGPTLISSDITTSTTWVLANSPYLVSGLVKVAAGAILTIDPGVQVQFLQDAGLQIDGGLSAAGTHAQPISFVANGAGIEWRGLQIVHPVASIRLQGVTIKNARAGVSIEPPQQAGPATGARVDILESLLDANVVGVSAKYGAGTAPHLTLRNNLLTNNSIGVQIDSLATPSLLTISYNSFVLNGIGMQAINVGTAVRAEHQWWGAAGGPQIGDSTYCSNPLPPNPAAEPPDVVCGSVDATPWSTVTAGRSVLPNDKEIVLASAIGAAALGDNSLAATSVVTLTIPANAFDSPVDIFVAPRSSADPLPGQLTALDFVISAVANGRQIDQLSAGKQATLLISYTKADLGTADPQKLRLYSLDETQGFWSYFGVGSAPDPANRRLFGQIDRPAHIRASAVDLAKVWLPSVSE